MIAKIQFDVSIVIDFYDSSDKCEVRKADSIWGGGTVRELSRDNRFLSQNQYR